MPREKPSQTDHDPGIPVPCGCADSWASLEASTVPWKRRCAGLLITPFPRRDRWRSEELGAGGWGPASGREGAAYSDLTQCRGRWLTGPHPNSEWKVLGSETGVGLGLPDPLGSWQPQPPWSTSPKAVYTQGWECLFFLIDFLQINPWPAERGSQQQLFTQCL